jgi:type IV pilus assembly protein PilQ
MVNKRSLTVFLFITPLLMAEDHLKLPPFASNLIREERVNRERSRTSNKKTNNKSSVRSESPSQAFNRFLYRQYENSTLTKKKISLTLKKADVRDVVALIGQNASISFLIDADVKGVVQSVHFTNTSLAAALRVILQSNNPQLALIKDENLHRIVRLSRAKDLFEQFWERDLEHAVISLIHTALNSKRKKQIENMWHGILGDAANNAQLYLVFDEQQRKVFFRGYKEHVAQFKEFLAEIDTQVPQIKIEARFVCAEKGFEDSLGVQASGVYNKRATSGKGFDLVGVGKPLSDIRNNPKEQPKESLIDWALNFVPTPEKAVKGLQLPFVFGGNDLNTKRLNLVLNAAESKNEIQTILRPTVLTNSGSTAKMLVGEAVPIETIVEESVEGRLRNVKTANYKDIGIQLKVSPIVAADKKSVFLNVFIENSQQSDVISSKDSSYPVVRTTRAQTCVRLESGQTAMISGLTKDVKEIYKKRAPGFDELPLLGWMFRGKRSVKQDLQLLIFITPTVVG